MARLFQIAVFSCLCLCLAGCDASEKSEPIWQNVKITDLAPSHPAKRPDSPLVKTADFAVYTFEIPAEKVEMLDDIWQMMYTQPLRFIDYDAFCANSFSVGFGRLQMWNKIADLLHAANGKKVEKTLLLLTDGRAETVVAAVLADEKTIFHISTSGAMEGVTLGPGKLAIRIKAEKIAGSRGVCSVDVQPAFLPPLKNPMLRRASAADTAPGEFVFAAAGFGLKMSPGDFFLVGPKEYSSSRITLGSAFFSKPQGSVFFDETERKPPQRKPSVSMFLFVCSAINY